MCFSAEASFGASAILLTIGAVAVKKSSTTPQRLLAGIPLVFGVQQFTEGILWLSLTYPAMVRWQQIATYTFLVFAQVVWPIMVPLSIFLLEPHKTNRKILNWFLALGAIVSAYLGYCLLFYRVQSSISCYHILYDVDYPKLFKYSGLTYFVATVFPPIVSSIKRLRLLGVAIFISYVVTIVFYENYLVSVWCYFASIISVVVLSVIVKLNKGVVSNSYTKKHPAQSAG